MNQEKNAHNPQNKQHQSPTLQPAPFEVFQLMNNNPDELAAKASEYKLALAKKIG